jgi:putative transposase
MKKIKQQHPFDINAMVVLPDHLHAMWTLPKDDADYPKRWMLIKSRFSRCIPITEYRRKSRMNKGERGVWQRRYWEHLIRDDRDYEQRVNYIHWPLLRILRPRHLCIHAHRNPVKHGYVKKPVDWQHSSIHRFIGAGVIDRNWGTTDSMNGDDYSERK